MIDAIAIASMLLAFAPLGWSLLRLLGGHS
jgi:hypothetical protein